MPKKQSKGKGWHGDAEGHARAGSAGGNVTAARHGEAFYSQIGRQGGKVSSGNFKYNPSRASKAGRKGGKSRHTEE